MGDQDFVFCLEAFGVLLASFHQCEDVHILLGYTLFFILIHVYVLIIDL